jgi:hypothetical protein
MILPGADETSQSPLSRITSTTRTVGEGLLII